MSAHTMAAVVAMVTITLCHVTMTTARRDCREPGVPQAPQSWNWTQYPFPMSELQEQQRQCCNSKQSPTCDPNGLITQAQADAIDLAIDSVYTNTSARCQNVVNKGYIIRVALMQRMTPVYPPRDNSTMERLRGARLYSYQISRRWNMKGNCGESLLILFSRDDNILFTLTRRETRRKLKDEMVADASITVRHYFQNVDTIAEGILELIARYRRVLSQN